MCNLSQGILEKGVEKANLSAIRALMETAGVSIEKAMDLLKIEERERPGLRKALEEQ